MSIPSISRRYVGGLLATLVTAAPLLVLAEDRVREQAISLGAPNAPVTVTEYASVTCPHCARFNADVFPLLKARYIDSGKVRYVFREVPIHANEDAAGFLIARCSGPSRYLAVTDALFRAQPALFEKQDLRSWLSAGAAAGGLDEAMMLACVSDAKAIEAFNVRAMHTFTVDKIQAAPTILVNGVRVEPSGQKELTFSDVDAAIRPLLRRTSRAAGKPVNERP